MITRNKLHFEGQFVQVPNAWARDARLSRKARGLLVELLSHTVGWEVTVDSLMDAGTEGRDAIRTAIKELVDHGYLVVHRQRNDAGQLQGTDYHLNDPWEVQILPTSDNPTLGKPTLDNQHTKNTIPSEDNPSEDDGGLFAHTAPAISKVSRMAHPLPDTFTVTEEMLTWARDKVPVAFGNVVLETEKFKAWHTSKGNKFKDWPAAWRNWMLNTQAYAERDGRQVVPAGSIATNSDWRKLEVNWDEP